ncbi:S-adenosyl-L-methionine-dependent methyltransferase [Aspergillus minisclerotigenes]|uniref:catechol O-methyltransferase n=1 Tax=Aspergillus minisclerotigenes TaxID=656917 RepID=A0A5N6J696_9EURO|nr:S-adenosyl-L-methionine-dependent methyltransferase [Aspergillus minisclerotigenes]
MFGGLRGGIAHRTASLTAHTCRCASKTYHPLDTFLATRARLYSFGYLNSLTSKTPRLVAFFSTLKIPLNEPDSLPHPRVGERSREAGQETKLLHFIYGQPNIDEIRGRPQKILDLMNKFEEEHYMMSVGAPKGRIVTDLTDEIKPKTMIELGCYMGYSAILFGDAVRRNGGERYLSLELNPEWAAIANMLIELAGLRDFVSKIELMFLDHYKPAYLTDLKLCEHHGMIVPGSVLAAGNVLYPGNPPYLEYVRSSVEQKREAAKGGHMKGYNLERISESQVNS